MASGDTEDGRTRKRGEPLTRDEFDDHAVDHANLTVDKRRASGSTALKWAHARLETPWIVMASPRKQAAT